MLSSKHIVFFALISLKISGFAEGACFISAIEKRPLLWRYLGTQSIVLPHKASEYRLEEGEQLRVECGGPIKISSNYGLYTNEKFTGSLIVKCSADIMHWRRPERLQWQELANQRVSFGCEQDQVAIYEGLPSLPHCEEFLSYGIGTRVSKDQQRILLKMCFDLANLQPRYVAYTPRDPDALVDVESITPVNDEQFTLRLKLDGFENLHEFPNKSVYEQALAKFGEKNVFIRPFVFDYAPLVQDENLERILSQYGGMLNIVWWHNLRLGNWKIFMEAFRKQVKLRKYQVFMGVSGTVAFPVDNCNEYEYLTVQVDQQTINTPEYIWALIEPLNGASKEKPFALVAYNSPFEKDLNGTEICEDICHEIDWLHMGLFNRTRQLKDFGLMNCCRPGDIVSMFDNFPLDTIKPSGSTAASTTVDV